MQLVSVLFFSSKVEENWTETHKQKNSLCLWAFLFGLAKLTSWGLHQLVMRMERAETKYILCQQV